MKLEGLIRQATDIMQGATRLVALTGAGISTPSGIPDFRSPQSGLWEQEEDMLQVASIYAFRHHPQAFYDWVRPLLHIILHAQPNPAHIALAQLENAGRLKAIITQNIDLLHEKAGSRNVYEVHGHLRDVVCPTCHYIIPAGPSLDEFMATGKIPRCRRCHHIMKPDVILFGELLPLPVLKAAQMYAHTCDVMLMAGSSLEVAPACDLPAIAKECGARLIFVNRGETPLDDLADVVIRADVAEVLPQLVAPFLDG